MNTRILDYTHTRIHTHISVSFIRVYMWHCTQMDESLYGWVWVSFFNCVHRHTHIYSTVDTLAYRQTFRWVLFVWNCGVLHIWMSLHMDEYVFCSSTNESSYGWVCVSEVYCLRSTALRMRDCYRKLQVSFAKEPYKRDSILQKRPTILSAWAHAFSTQSICRAHHVALDETPLQKEPYNSAKEPYIHAYIARASTTSNHVALDKTPPQKEPYICAVELCKSAKEPYICAVELCKSAKEPYIHAWPCVSQSICWAMSHI